MCVLPVVFAVGAGKRISTRVSPLRLGMDTELAPKHPCPLGRANDPKPIMAMAYASTFQANAIVGHCERAQRPRA